MDHTRTFVNKVIAAGIVHGRGGSAMRVTRKLDNDDGTLTLCVTVHFNERELSLVEQLGLKHYRIRTKEGLLGGLDTTPRNLKAAHRTQLGRVKDRWSAALNVTSGFAIVDIASSLTDLVVSKIAAIVLLVVGRRKKLADVMKGLSVTSRNVERIKEAEFFIFFSLAAIFKAMVYATQFGSESSFDDSDFIRHLDGLDFAGAGTDVEDDLAEITSVLSHSLKH